MSRSVWEYQSVVVSRGACVGAGAVAPGCVLELRTEGGEEGAEEWAGGVGAERGVARAQQHHHPLPPAMTTTMMMMHTAMMMMMMMMMMTMMMMHTAMPPPRVTEHRAPRPRLN
jgi:hypothetical protein